MAGGPQLPLVAEKALLAPMAHDEPPLRLGLFRQLFHLPRGLIFNTEEERDLVHGRFRNGHLPWTVGGTGIDLPPSPPQRPEPAPGADYLLYLGRVDVEKGCGELVEQVRALRAAGGPAARLVLAGEVKMKLPRDAAVETAGYVSAERKRELLEGALALVVPSRYESLSLAALEAWAHGTPVVARAGSPVLAGHLARSGGGWSYEGAAGLAEVLAELRGSPGERRCRGLAGRAYVEERYSWERAIGAYAAFLERMGALVAGGGGAGRH